MGREADRSVKGKGEGRVRGDREGRGIEKMEWKNNKKKRCERFFYILTVCGDLTEGKEVKWRERKGIAGRRRKGQRDGKGVRERSVKLKEGERS